MRIVKTAKQLDKEGGWWSRQPYFDGTRVDVDAKRIHAQALSTGLPHWLRPPRTPLDEARAGVATAERESRAAGAYLAGRRIVTPTEMTDAQRQSALGAIARRFAGHDGALDFTLAPEGVA